VCVMPDAVSRVSLSFTTLHLCFLMYVACCSALKLLFTSPLTHIAPEAGFFMASLLVSREHIEMGIVPGSFVHDALTYNQLCRTIREKALRVVGIFFGVFLSLCGGL
jgi:hypothetical protein